MADPRGSSIPPPGSCRDPAWWAMNWLTAIFGFLAAYGAAALVFVVTRNGYAAETATMLIAFIFAALLAAAVNEWRARRAKRRGASVAAPKLKP
jgi:hypothetical protein